MFLLFFIFYFLAQSHILPPTPNLILRSDHNIIPHIRNLPLKEKVPTCYDIVLPFFRLSSARSSVGGKIFVQQFLVVSTATPTWEVPIIEVIGIET